MTEYAKQSGRFLTLKDGIAEFLATSGVEEAIHTDVEREAAERLIYGGCQVFGFALSNIKIVCEDDPVKAVPMILALYEEMASFARACIAEDEAREQEKKQVEQIRAAWPFPTGAKN